MRLLLSMGQVSSMWPARPLDSGRTDRRAGGQVGGWVVAYSPCFSSYSPITKLHIANCSAHYEQA